MKFDGVENLNKQLNKQLQPNLKLKSNKKPKNINTLKLETNLKQKYLN